MNHSGDAVASEIEKIPFLSSPKERARINILALLVA